MMPRRAHGAWPLHVNTSWLLYVAPVYVKRARLHIRALALCTCTVHRRHRSPSLAIILALYAIHTAAARGELAR